MWKTMTTEALASEFKTAVKRLADARADLDRCGKQVATAKQRLRAMRELLAVDDVVVALPFEL